MYQRKMTSKSSTKYWKLLALLETIHSDISVPLRSRTHGKIDFVWFIWALKSLKFLIVTYFMSGVKYEGM